MAANQVGKTLGAGNETSYHATGDYPPDWKGRRFHRPTKGWVANTNNETVRDNPQRILLGESAQWGKGTIPRSAFHKPPTMSRGFPDLVDSVQIKHISGGISVIQFKAYDQGRKRWQGSTLDYIWFDEEPPLEIYTEGLARISATGGMVYMTQTPLLGLSDVVLNFYPEPDTDARGLVQMDLDDAAHFDPHEREIIIAAYPEHERDARARGLPLLGSGKVFPVAISAIEIEAFDIPLHWPRLIGADFGYGAHPCGFVKSAWDRDSDCLYFTHCYKEKKTEKSIHVSAMRPWFSGDPRCPVAWPHDGHREWGDSIPLADAYREEGLPMLRTHSTFKGPKGGYSTEAGVGQLLGRMQHGKLKVFTHLKPWWDEFLTYHRKDGMIVKKKDDLMSASRMIEMMLRYARVPKGSSQYSPTVDHEFDEFAVGR